ncbi:MAG: hypothetical protein NC932_03275 [Candidatus Omnitrophica bacterium]|nr:hypothetical protein [Candidatus Omnitrophota bacterium]
MKENLFAVISGIIAGLVVYSFIGWVFTRKTSIAIRYIIIFFLSLILLVLVVMLIK